MGHIDDTALPGTDGNSGIAGHRDGFFRGLKDIGPGDAIELETLRGKEVYRVERTWVVDPEDVSVLDPTPTRSLTLVTCYPFYHVGPAPQRYIVRAVRTDTAAAVHRAPEQADMKYAREFITSTVVGGLFIVVPVYLAVLLLLKGMKSVGGLVRPFAALVPDWLPAESLLSLVLVLASVSSSVSLCVLERGARFASAWRGCSSRGFPGTACCAA